MKNQVIVTTSLCALLGMPLAAASETQPTVQQVLQNIAEGSHPFYDKGMYPDWSRLTPEQARTDSAAALVLARHRIEQISNLRSEETTFENTFLALSHAQEELDKVQNRIYHLTTVADNGDLRKVQEELMPEWNAKGA